MENTFTTNRKEKRWLVFKKLSVIYQGQIIEPDDTHALTVKTGYNSTEVAVEDPQNSWILVDEISSFELAKKKVIETARDIGLSKVRLCRTVDLSTVLYPIS